MISAKNISEEKAVWVPKGFLLPQKAFQRSLFAVMTIISMEDLNLQHFQENNINNLSNHKFSPPMQIITTVAKPKLISGQIFKPFCCAVFLGGLFFGFGLGFLWLLICYFSSSILEMSCPRGCSEQSTTLLTPSPVVSNFRCNYSTLTPGNERSWTEKSQWKATQKWVIFTGKQ